jgi:hypothetical protein
MRFSLALLAWLLAGFVAAAGASISPAPESSPAVSSGGVYVTTLPSGADVWIDGTYCGRSPILLDALMQGKHVLTLTKTGWNVQEAEVDVPGGGISLWSTKLPPASRSSADRETGKVVVHGLSHDAKVSIDGNPRRELHGATVLSEGPHILEFSTPRGKAIRAFTVFPDMISDLVLREERARASHVGVIAPAGDYLPPEAIAVDGRLVRIRYDGHKVLARLDREWMRLDGTPVSYNSAPSMINGKLYLPLDLLDLLTK